MLREGFKKSMEISIRGGKPVPHFFLYPQFIQKCSKNFFRGGTPSLITTANG